MNVRLGFFLLGFSLPVLIAVGLVEGRALYLAAERDEPTPARRIDYPRPRPCTAGPDGDACLYGVFVGMGRSRTGQASLMANQNMTSLRDVLVSRHLMREEDATVLTDQNANLRGIQEAAARLSARMRPQDLFIFAFKGHGLPNGVRVWDDELRKGRLRSLLLRVPAERVLLVMHSCYSGSFASLADLRAKRVTGFFSSRADEMSSALDFGGVLPAYFARAVYDLGADGTVSTHDLRDYLEKAYSRHERNTAGQHLLVRGPDVVLWRAWPEEWTER